MKTKINLKGEFPKVCVDCEIELNPGVNCYISMYKLSSYKCKSCKKKQSDIEHLVKWQIPSFRAQKDAYLRKYHKQEPAGVYAIYEKDEIIYIGESGKPIQRFIAHFSKHKRNKDSNQFQNPIQLALIKGEIDRIDLSWDIIHYEHDKKLRKEKEVKAIKNHYITFGSYPKYNKNHTGAKRVEYKKRSSGDKTLQDKK